MEMEANKKTLKISEMHQHLIDTSFGSYLQRTDSTLWKEIQNQIKTYMYKCVKISQTQKDHIYKLFELTHTFNSQEDLEEALMCRVRNVNSAASEANNICALTIEEAEELIYYLEQEYWEIANDVSIIISDNKNGNKEQRPANILARELARIKEALKKTGKFGTIKCFNQLIKDVSDDKANTIEELTAEQKATMDLIIKQDDRLFDAWFKTVVMQASDARTADVKMLTGEEMEKLIKELEREYTMKTVYDIN